MCVCVYKDIYKDIYVLRACVYVVVLSVHKEQIFPYKDLLVLRKKRQFFTRKEKKCQQL